jgi:tetratricopeptide (TPR) repeat protein
MALWSQQSPDYARRRQAMQDFFAASRDIQLKSLALISVTVEGNTARVQVEVEIALTDMTSGQPSPRVGQLQRVLYLVREDDMWKVWRYLPADLVQALWEASTKEERLWLLRAEKEQLTEAKLTGINEVAVEEAQQGRFERAEQLNEIACQAAAVLGDTAQQGRCMLYQGMIFHHQARYPLAVDHFTQAQALFRTAEDRRGEAVTLTNLGAAYGQMGRYAEALASFDARLKLDERDFMIKPEDLELSGPLPQEVMQVLQEMPKFQDPITLSNMASVYQIMGQNDQAVRLFEASLKTVQGMQNETGKMAQMAALNNLGNVYHATSRYPEALKAYQESARLAQDLGDKSGEAAALNNIGDVHRLTGSDAAAREVIEKSLKIAQTAGN